MSVLEVFVRARQYRDRAAEFFELAAQPFSEEVRARYLAIADHYMALAEAEIRTDRLIRQKRLEQMRAAREKARRADPAPAADRPPAPHAAGPAKLQPVQGAKQPARRSSSGPAQMAAQSVFTIVGTAR
jgi:hypothetical protein